MQLSPLLEPTDRGLFCPPGNFYVDPWRPVDLAVVTHAHADHARGGCGAYLTSREGHEVLRARMGPKANIETLEYGEKRVVNGVTVSLHPAGHILGSAQVRLEHKGQVWVFSGDYKTQPDRTTTAFEPVQCHTFITECTFGLPIYRWASEDSIFTGINEWWRKNQGLGRTTLLFGWSLGKAQRILAGLDRSVGPIMVHGAVERLIPAYRASGVDLPEVVRVNDNNIREVLGRAVVVAPPSAAGSPWIKKFGDAAMGFVSGWMLVRGARRWQSLDRGFALSDHADWPGLLEAIKATGAENIGVTHGNIDTLVRFLNETTSLNAFPVPTRYRGDEGEDAEGAELGGEHDPADGEEQGS